MKYLCTVKVNLNKLDWNTLAQENKHLEFGLTLKWSLRKGTQTLLALLNINNQVSDCSLT